MTRSSAVMEVMRLNCFFQLYWCFFVCSKEANSIVTNSGMCMCVLASPVKGLSEKCSLKVDHVCVLELCECLSLICTTKYKPKA